MLPDPHPGEQGGPTAGILRAQVLQGCHPVPGDPRLLLGVQGLGEGGLEPGKAGPLSWWGWASAPWELRGPGWKPSSGCGWGLCGQWGPLSGLSECQGNLKSVLGWMWLRLAPKSLLLPLQVGGQGLEWSVAQRATQEAVGQELVALRQAWERGGDLARAHGPYRLVRTEAGGPAGPGLRAAQVIGGLQSREACLEETLRQLQAQCQQQLARLAGALPSLIWIPPPGR